MILESFINNKKENINENIDIIKIPLKNLSLKLLKRRILTYQETLNAIRYNFFVKRNGFTLNRNETVYVPNITLNKFILNITPVGIKKTTKENVLGVELLNKRKKELLFEEERKRNKKEPGKNIDVEGPGR